MISQEAFAAAIEWLRNANKERREFISLDADQRELTVLEQQGYARFMASFENWQPSALEPYAVPKGDGRNRDVFYIPVFDRVATLALLLTDYPKLRAGIAPVSKDVDHAYPLPDDISNATWFTRFKQEYASFRARTHSIQKGKRSLVFTDITNFAPSCRMDTLQSLLTSLGMDTARAQKLCDTFRHWQRHDGLSGIPQGYCMTDLLLKVYMHPIDKAMKALHPEGIIFYRYVDDLRVAAHDGDTLKRGYQTLCRLMDDAGLVLKHEKTAWHTPDKPHVGSKDAVQIEDYLQPCWTGLRLKDRDFQESAADVRSFMPYENLPAALLQSVYNTYIKPGANPILPPVTLFNFVIRRMGRAGMALPAPDVIGVIQADNSRFGLMLDFLKQTSGSISNAQMASLLPAIEELSSGHPYHRYLFIRFLGDMAQHDACKAMIGKIAESVGHDTPSFIKKAVIGALHLAGQFPPNSQPNQHAHLNTI